jgi:GNAT superfamily N-acetyltransferase
MASDPAGAGVRVRLAEARDACVMAVLCGQLGYPSTTKDIERRLAQAGDGVNSVVLVADSHRDGVIGWVHVRALHLLTRDACAELGGLVVDEAWRGRGIGGRLMDAAEDWARRQGLGTLRLRSNVIREGAHAFYRGRGYTSAKTSLLFTKTL